MSYYRVCPHCGAHLDSGERCDCQDEKKAAVSASNADSGKGGNLAFIPYSTYMIPERGQECKHEN